MIALASILGLLLLAQFARFVETRRRGGAVRLAPVFVPLYVRLCRWASQRLAIHVLAVEAGLSAYRAVLESESQGVIAQVESER